METATFNFYGVGLVVTSPAAALIANLKRDFEYFSAPAPVGAVTIAALIEEPPWHRIPDATASMVTPKAVSYDDGAIRYNDYHGQALAIYDFAAEKGELWGLDFDLLYELTYLMALSRVGELHDRRGIHRIHALGVAVAGQGALILLPEAGGKTTLALELLKNEKIQILSDDTPLLANGKLRAFPTRMGMRGQVAGIEAEHLRTFHRRSHGGKTLIDVSYFRERVIAEASAAVLIVGERSSRADSSIEPIGRMKLLPVVTANLVFGLGLPQVVEYFLRGGAREMVHKAAIVRSRTLAGIQLVWKAKCYRLRLGRSVESAAEAVLSVIG